MPIKKSQKRIKKNRSKPTFGWSAKTIIAGIVLFSFIGLFFPLIHVAHGQATYQGPGAASVVNPPNTPDTPLFGNLAIDLVQWILQGTISFVYYLLKWLLVAAAACMEIALKLGFTNLLPVVEVGWKLTRDIANMFFILVMIVVAFATILRIEQYGIKKLLPKVIIIALLINFSLVICSVIIDFTNIAAMFFVNGISKGAIVANLTDGLNLLKADTPQAEDFPEVSGTQKQEAEKIVEDLQAPSEWVVFLQFILSMTVGSLVLLVASFTMLAGAVFLFIRAVVIWFLLIFVPFVFICYIMPGLRKLWQDWWKTFLKWCLFAPAYSFFIWLAIKIVAEGALKQTIINNAGGMITWSKFGLVNAFVLFPQYLIQFGFIIALLLGGLVAASKFGIYGAGAAMGIVQKAYGGAKGWAARTSMRPIKAGATAVGAGALTAGAGLFGKESKIGRRMKARATQLREAAAERPEHKKYAALLATMSAPDRLKEMHTKGIRGKIAAKQNLKDGLLRDADLADVNVAMNKFRTFNDSESLQKLKETRLDAVEDKTEQEETTKKVVQEGNLNKIPAIALKDERLVAAIATFASAVQMESLRNVSPQHKDELETRLGKITNPANAAEMTAMGINPTLDKIQHAYASQTGDIGRMTNTQLEKWAKTAGPDGIKRISSTSPPAAIHIVAENIPTNQLANVVEKIQDSAAAKEMVRYLDTSTSPTAAANKKVVKKNPYLKTLIP